MAGNTVPGCIPASERLGPFGHLSRHEEQENRPWTSLQWGSLQNNCAAENFPTHDANGTTHPRKLRRAFVVLDEELVSTRMDGRRTGRTAVVLRTWDNYKYSNNRLAWLRTVITELSMDTGGEFQVFLLVNVKDLSLNLFDDKVYTEALERYVPKEFQDMALLYHEGLLREWYPKVDEHGAQDQMYQALQIFSHFFPEFDFLWQLEMDVRFAGNVARMLTNTGLWARDQPQKNLWERNGRWFIPGLWKDYAAFSAQVDGEFSDEEGIWGPPPYAKFWLMPQGPTPPDKTDKDWGLAKMLSLSILHRLSILPVPVGFMRTQFTVLNQLGAFHVVWLL